MCPEAGHILIAGESVSRHHTHDGPPVCWCSFTGVLILVLHGQCVTQVARGDIVIIMDWCLCDCLVLKHIDEFYHTSSSLVIYWCWHIFVWKMLKNLNIVFDSNCSYHFWLMSVWFFLYWKILMKCKHFIFIWHLLMLTYFHVENVP